MKREEIRICVMRVGGTNCDSETKRAFSDLGVRTETIHLNRLIKKEELFDYTALVFPGGFSYGDYVRAGAIWAKSAQTKLHKDLMGFVEEGRPILGICNGFQVLVEAGLLPGFEGVSEYPEAALATNVPIGYRCNWVYMKHENSGRCLFTQKIQKGRVLRMPVAHAEGRFLFSKEKEDRYLKELYDNDQIVFRYCYENGEHANGGYLANPNGAFHDIAGICNPEGTIFGLMPHPERACYGWQLPDWTKEEMMMESGDGRLIFESMIEYLSKKP
ncbi:MAG: phosphoribosylformylglycinamidine synthase subunit PurQ [Candidatus Bathyarchaeota archaeon]|nr:MAG: phosphoribosylformylglycinamidine synthase subunit PurQ [Candidatus Bathyarchaeota archaeon]